MSNNRLTTEEWEELLADAETRLWAPLHGLRCDARRYGCQKRATRVIAGVRLALCAAHLHELEHRAAAAGGLNNP